MAEPWLPGARRDGRAWTGYTMDRATSSRRATWHTTENGQSSTLDGVANYMASNAGLGTGYTILLHPSTGDMLQLRPADVGAGSLRTVSGYPSYNKSGTVHVQLSVCAYAGEPWWSKYACPWFPKVIDWLRSWGIADAEVAVPVSNGRMSESAWRGSQSGHAAHRTVPNQDHTDAGALPAPWTIGGGGGGTPPIPTPVPPDQSAVLPVDGGGSVTVRVLRSGHSGRDVRQTQALLSEWAISPGKHDGIFGGKTDSAVRSFQGARGLTVDGIVGERTWGSLLGY